MTLKIHVEVFIAAHMLAQKQDTFTLEALEEEIVQQFGDTRASIRNQILEHCIANTPRSTGAVHNYLWRTAQEQLRPFNVQTDHPHPSRLSGGTKPDSRDMPSEYLHLITTPPETPPPMIVREVSSEGPPLLYLLKSATNNERLQENLQILAAQVETQCDIHYHHTRRWMLPDPWGDAARWVTPAPWKHIGHGEKICIVFCDRPYWNFVPVRQGQVLEAHEEDETLVLRVKLGTFVEKVDLEAFSRHFRELTQRRFFIVRDPATSLSFLPEGEDDHNAWRQIANTLHLSSEEHWESPYTQTTFLRALQLTDTNGQPLSQEDPLEAGKTYLQILDCYAPHLTPDLTEGHSLVLNPENSNIRIADTLPLVPNGQVSLKINPVEPGKVALKIWVRPERAQSTALNLEYQVAPPASMANATMGSTVECPPAVLNDRHLRVIFEVLQEPEGPARDQAQLSLIEHVLGPISQESHYLKEQRGMTLYHLKRWDEAYQQFAALDLDRLSPRAIVAWFVSACRGGIDTDLGTILSRFNAWEQRALVDQLIAALPMVEESRRLQILQDAWLGAGRYHEMWEALKNSFTRPDLILKAAELMVDPTLYHILTPAQGYSYLRDHTNSWEEAPIEFLKRAVAWGLQESDQAPDLDDAFLCLLERLLQRGSDPMELWGLVDNARGLSPYTWTMATEQLADAFSSSPQEEWRTQACLFYIELARVYRERLQDLDKAEECLTQAQLMVGENADLAEQVNAEEASWEAALERIEAVKIWREGLLEIRIKRLREMLQGKRALFVGGADRGFDIESVRRELGLAEAEFVPYYRSERGSLNKVRQRIQQGKVDYIVDFASLGAHRNLEGYCYNAGVAYIRVMHSRSLDQIVRAFALAHNLKIES